MLKYLLKTQLFCSFDCLLCSLYAVRLIIAFVDVNKTYLILSYTATRLRTRTRTRTRLPEPVPFMKYVCVSSHAAAPTSFLCFLSPNFSHLLSDNISMIRLFFFF